MYDKEKMNLISVLNEIQNFIIYLICASFIITEKETYNSKTYDEI